MTDKLNFEYDRLAEIFCHIAILEKIQAKPYSHLA